MRAASPSRADPWAARRYATFGNENIGWVSLEVHGGKPARVPFPPGWQPREATVAPSGRVVFTAFDKNAKNHLLFLWDPLRPLSPPVSIGDSRGFHSAPFVTQDEQWVYFAHNPNAFGPPMQHEKQAFAQIYRSHLDGSNLEELTSNDGCHFGPAATTSGRAIFVHTTCRIGMWLEQWEPRNGAAQKISGNDAVLIGLDVSPDDKYVLITLLRSGRTLVRERTLSSGLEHEVLSDELGPQTVRAAYGATRSAIYFQHRQAVWLKEGEAPEREIAHLRGGEL